ALRHLKKATRILLAKFPFLEEDSQEGMVRLRDKKSHTVLVDLIKPTQPWLRVIFKHTEKVEHGKQQYRIPTIEMALALKFAPMVSLVREHKKKFIDAHDFIDMIHQNPNLDEALLRSLGDLVYDGGGEEIVEMLRRVRAGEKLVF